MTLIVIILLVGVVAIQLFVPQKIVDGQIKTFGKSEGEEEPVKPVV